MQTKTIVVFCELFAGFIHGKHGSIRQRICFCFGNSNQLHTIVCKVSIPSFFGSPGMDAGEAEAQQ